MYRRILACLVLSVLMFGCSQKKGVERREAEKSRAGEVDAAAKRLEDTVASKRGRAGSEELAPLEDDAAPATASNPLIRGLQEQIDSSPVFRDNGEGLYESLAEADRTLSRIRQENRDALREASRQVVINANRPNILLVVVHDLGYGDLGSYGQKRIKTPHLDELASQGIRFTSFYAGSPRSDASWWCLLTGRYTANSGQSSYTIAPQSVTLAEVMWQGAYETAFFGNWFLSGSDHSALPHLHGFDSWFGTLCDDPSIDPFPEYVLDGGVRVRITGNADGRRGVEGNGFFVQESVSYLKRRSSDKPFFLTMAYSLSDLPQPASTTGIYRDEEWTDEQRARAAVVSRFDTHVGQLLATLDQLDLARRTAVFITSDTTSAREQDDVSLFFNSNGGLRGSRGNLYEGGLRVPLIARYPGQFPAGEVTDYAAAVWDLLPTFVELGGVSRRPARLDGTSLVSVLRGKAGEPHKRFYWEAHDGGFSQAVRMGRWKAVRPAGKMMQEDIELYDLAEDPSETKDLAFERPDIVDKAISNRVQ